MKRRTLIWGSILAIVAPVRAAFVSRNFKNETDNSVDPYDAVKIVYDNFITDGPFSEIEFDEPVFSEGPSDHSKIRCKLVELNSDRHRRCDTWLIFFESLQEFSGSFTKKRRDLMVIKIITKEAHNFLTPELYEVENILKNSWRQNSKTVVTTGESHYPNSISRRMETGPIFRSDDGKNKNDPEIVALSEFLGLING